MHHTCMLYMMILMQMIVLVLSTQVPSDGTIVNQTFVYMEVTFGDVLVLGVVIEIGRAHV